MSVAIIGCGNIANMHAKALLQLGKKLHVVVDNDIEQARRFKDNWGASLAANKLEKALVKEVHSVHLCTPPALHYSMAKQILQAQKNLICEKPLCLSAAQAKELYQLARQNNLIAAVNFNVRYHMACQKAKEIIKEPEFGKINLIHGSYLQEFHLLPAEYMWRYRPEISGNMRAVTEIGSHLVDLLRFWTGLEIGEVSANFANFTPKRLIKDGMMYAQEKDEAGQALTVTTEDAAVISLRFANGAIGCLFLSEVSCGRSNQINLEVSSGKQSIWWCSENPYLLNTAKGKFSGVTAQVNAFGGGFLETFLDFFSQVYGAMENGTDASYPSFFDGYANAAVCQAIYKSANSNSAWVKVDMVCP